MCAGAGNGAPPADEAPKLLSAKPQLSRAPTRGGVRGGRGQQVDPNSIPAGGCAPSPHMRASAHPVCACHGSHIYSPFQLPVLTASLQSGRKSEAAQVSSWGDPQREGGSLQLTGEGRPTAMISQSL